MLELKEKYRDSTVTKYRVDRWKVDLVKEGEGVLFTCDCGDAFELRGTLDAITSLIEGRLDADNYKFLIWQHAGEIINDAQLEEILKDYPSTRPMCERCNAVFVESDGDYCADCFDAICERA